MVKLKNVKFYDLGDVPDHVIEEVYKLAEKIGNAVNSVAENEPANLVLSAMSFVHACIILHLIEENEEAYKNAAQIAAIGIMKNMEAFLLNAEIIKEPWFAKEGKE